MADPRVLDESAPPGPTGPNPGGGRAGTLPRAAYQSALERYEGIHLVEIHRALGLVDDASKPRALIGVITDRLADPRVAERAIQRLEPGPRQALTLFALTESATWSVPGLLHALSCLGVDGRGSLRALLELGLVAAEAPDQGAIGDFGRFCERPSMIGARIHVHPAVSSQSRTVLPQAAPARHEGPARRVRETDGLEAILRLAAIWQRVDEGPLRRTQQGTLYKRDRDRLEDDPVLAGAIADSLEPIPDMAAFWLELARGVGLVVDEPEGERIVAARPGFWTENAFHLPQMIATRWLALRTWHEQGGMQHEGSTVELALPFARPAILLWLATLDEDEWVALDDLKRHLRGIYPEWDRAAFLDPSTESAASPPRPARGRTPKAKREKGKVESSTGPGVLESVLLGAGYQLGLIRAAEGPEDDGGGGRMLVQLSPLGRYILALGPPPPPRPAFEHFLYVQPNFEVIAYRQGLTASLIGQFSRFAHWSKVGAALELKLTAESVYRGLEGGLSPQEMLDRLARHSQRALPAGVAEALRTWAGRRERVTYHASATLVEFASRTDLEHALAQWPAAARVPPVVISERLLLVEDDASIPFQRFRLAGARDYRRAPEACLEVEPDGVTLSLDLGRSDLLVDAELARFADELPLDAARGTPGNPRRRFRVSSGSIARGLENGLTLGVLSSWYVRRTGAEMPPAVRLVSMALNSRVPPMATSRPLLLHTPSAELLDGLLQHPETAPHLGTRLGPTSVVVPDQSLDAFCRALERLGLSLREPTSDATEALTTLNEVQLRRTRRT